MATDSIPASAPRPARLISVVAWGAILILSDMPEVAWNELGGAVPVWLPWAKLGLLAALLLISSLWTRLRPLRPFAFVFAVFILALKARDGLGESAWWQARFGGGTPTFSQAYLRFHVLDVIVAVAVLAALYLLTRRRSAFFLVRGNLEAPIEPVRWLGIRQGESWKTFGWIFTLAAMLAVSIVLATSLPLKGAALPRAVPMLPIVLLLAAMNAFAEEAYFRCSLFGTLHPVVGTQPVLLMNAVLFGMAHYIGGSPPGLPGALLTGFLGWLLGKAMLETRGFAWSWIIHFVPDVLFFGSYAIAWGWI